MIRKLAKYFMLNYGYILYESKHLSEVSVLDFTRQILRAIEKDLQIANDKIQSSGVCGKNNRCAFPQQEDSRLYVTMANYVDSLKGHRYDIYNSSKDGVGQIFNSPESVANAIINYAKKNPKSEIGIVWNKNPDVFERAAMQLCQDYFSIVADVRRRRA